MKGEVSVNRNRSMCHVSINGSRIDLWFPILKGEFFIIDYKYSLKKEKEKEEFISYETDFCTVAMGSIRSTGKEIELIKYQDILRNNWNWKLALKVLNEMKVYNTLRDQTRMVSLVDIMLLLKFKSPEDKSRKISNCEFRDMYLVFERFGDDLGYILNQKPTPPPLLDIKTQQWLLSQLLLAVSSLHSQKLIHRKLRPSNVLVSFEEKILKLRGFGSSSGFSSSKVDEDYDDEEEEEEEEDEEITRIYTAPEIILGRADTPSVDVWGVGCIFAEILSGGSPLFFLPSGRAEHTDDTYKIGMIIKNLETNLNKLSPNPLAIDLLKRMLEFYPDTRISVEEAMQHSYFGGKEEEQLVVSRVVAEADEEEDMGVVEEDTETTTTTTAAIGLGMVEVTEPDAHSLRKLIWNEMKTFERNNNILN